jgi:hypothetical protein
MSDFNTLLSNCAPVSKTNNSVKRRFSKDQTQLKDQIANLHALR